MNPKAKIKRTIAVDFDGVIHGYSKGWCSGDLYDEPKLGCRAALQTLKSLGFEVVIYSTRCHNEHLEPMRENLDKYEIPYDRIHTEPGKPLCVLFIDDNAYRFEGDWFLELPDIIALLRKYL